MASLHCKSVKRELQLVINQGLLRSIAVERLRCVASAESHSADLQTDMCMMYLLTQLHSHVPPLGCAQITQRSTLRRQDWSLNSLRLLSGSTFISQFEKPSVTTVDQSVSVLVFPNRSASRATPHLAIHRELILGEFRISSMALWTTEGAV